jgi:hypothetical protein
MRKIAILRQGAQTRSEADPNDLASLVSGISGNMDHGCENPEPGSGNRLRPSDTIGVYEHVHEYEE